MLHAGGPRRFGDTLLAARAAAPADKPLAGTPDDIAHHLWAGMHGYVPLELAGMDMANGAEVRTARFQQGLQHLLRGLRARAQFASDRRDQINTEVATRPRPLRLAT